MPDVQHKRGTRASFQALVTGTSLLPGQIYYITDEDVIELALTNSTFKTFVPKDEVIGFVNHGGTAGTARPTGWATVVWQGTVQPTNANASDLVVREDEAV